MKHKKGSIWETFTFLIFFFVLAIGIIIGYIGFSSLSNALGSIDVPLDHYNESYERYIESKADSYPGFWDPLLMVIFFGIFFIVCILSWFTPNLTIFTIIYWMMAFFLIIAGVFISISYTTVLSAESLQPYTDSFPMTVFYFKWAWLIWIFKIVTVGVLLYANPGSEGGSVV